MNDSLKPCPFCGGHAIIDGCDDTLWIVICKECNASIGYKETEQEAIEEWNRRVQPTFTPDEIDAIRRMFRDSYPRARELPNIEQAIIDKCAAALKGEAE